VSEHLAALFRRGAMLRARCACGWVSAWVFAPIAAELAAERHGREAGR
jgi:hypothetical protein